MPIKAKNIIVGVQKTPTPNQEPVASSARGIKVFGSIINKSANVEEQKPVDSPKPVIKKMGKTVSEEETTVNSRYLNRKDGELIRHINTKSQYMKDVFEDF